MTEFVRSYAVTLLELGVDRQEILSCKTIFRDQEVLKFFDNPTVPMETKHQLLGKVFSGEFLACLKVLCDNSYFGHILSIIDIYDIIWHKHNNVVKAVFSYVCMPTKEQIQEVRSFIQEKYHAKEVELIFREDKRLLGGCILTVEETVYDRSVASAIAGLRERLAGA